MGIKDAGKETSEPMGRLDVRITVARKEKLLRIAGAQYRSITSLFNEWIDKAEEPK